VQDAGLHSEGDFGLDPAALELLWQMEDRHFWHKARVSWLVAALRRYEIPRGARILDVGCGSGVVAGAFARAGYKVTGIDTAEVLIRKADSRFPEVDFVVGRVGDLPPQFRGPYDVIGLFDVLEHLADPLPLINDALRWARPGALVVTTVPALMSLYSAIDQLSGHKRRYEVGELSALMARTGLQKVREFGMFRFLLGLLRLQRSRFPSEPQKQYSAEEVRELFRENTRVPSPVLNLASRLLCRIEQELTFNWFAGRAGASLLAIGVTPG
jgi:SAM-dependent methyltransferase